MNIQDNQDVQKLTENMCLWIQGLLKDKTSFHKRLVEQKQLNGESCDYALSLSKIQDLYLSLDEYLYPQGEGLTQSYKWLFYKKDETWILVHGEKNGEPLLEETLRIELIDQFRRAQSAINISEIESPTIPLQGLAYKPKLKTSGPSFLGVTLVGILFFLALFLGSFQSSRMFKIVSILDGAIKESDIESEEQISILEGRLTLLSKDFNQLKSSVEQEQEAFLFNRKQSFMNVRYLAEQLSYRDSSRKRAYLYLADKIDQANSYGELFYQLSRLPQTNDQAETLLATDRGNNFTLSHYRPIFPSIGLPVRVDKDALNETLFMISSGFIERRLSPLGYGGVKPHLALDIINLDNIVKISKNNHIIRDETKPGEVVAVTEGQVISNHFDWVYGWSMEIQHPLSQEVLERFPNATSWSSFYAHMAHEGAYKEGELVKEGQVLGEIGNTGKSTGPHLHFEIRVYSPNGSTESSYGSYTQVRPFYRVETSSDIKIDSTEEAPSLAVRK